MNHLFQHITWPEYAELLAVALLAYYLYIGLRWYRAEIAKLFREAAPSPSGYQQPPAQTIEMENPASASGSAQAPQQHEGAGEANLLTTALLAAIAERSAGPQEPAATTQKLKAIIRRYPGIGNSPQRAAINSLIVAECKKTGITQLSEEEVDTWWQG